MITSRLVALLALVQTAVLATVNVPLRNRATSTSLSSTSSLPPAPTGTVPAGYLQTTGSSFVTKSGQKVILHGVNLGGWLVIEDWMCGITDSTDDSGPHPYRQSLKTLTSRFGLSAALNLTASWEQNFLSASDFTNIKNLGFNLVRVPFSYQTLQNADGSWRSDAFTQLDWAIQQAKANGIYVILSFHIWQTQAEDYSLISENSDEGQSARVAAQKIWEYVSNHYLGEGTIAAFDVINEPTGSYANYLQRNLYSAVRSVDANRIILMEAYSGKPSTYNWSQVAYSFHEYNMQSSNFTANQQAWQNDKAIIQQYQAIPVPFYMGEFMAVNDTLTYLLGQMNDLSLAWSPWTWKAVDEGSWAFYNYPSQPYRVNINNDSYDSILSAWQGLSKVQATQNTKLVNWYAGNI